LLCHIPDDAQNNPLILYMDENSVLKGFRATFGIQNEEIALRFYKLFTEI
jgi:hypothetical protein